MVKGIQWMIERLVERFIPLVGGLFASTVETFHALGQAEHQSQLEEAARRYEAEGKLDIATSLRQRASQLTSDDPAAQAVRIAESIATQPLLPPPNAEPDNPDPPRLPASRPAKSKSRRKKASSGQDNQNRPTLPPLDPNKSH